MKIAFRAANGNYIRADLTAGGLLAADRGVIGPWETFELVDCGGSAVALVAANGLYVCAEDGGGREVIANRVARGAWETFCVVELGLGKIALRTFTGKLLRPLDGGALIHAIADRVGPETVFTEIPEGMVERLQELDAVGKRI